MTMQINDLEFFLVEIDYEAVSEPVHSLIVRITTEDSVCGWGETCCPWRRQELPARREALLAVLAGRNVFDIEELLTLEALAENSLRAGLEMACWDALARSLRRPLSHLWGGVYRRRIPLTVRLTPGYPAAVAQIARSSAEKGFYSQIITSSGDPWRDAETAAAVRENVGGRSEVRLDGQAFYDVSAARTLCEELEPAGLHMLIDPVNSDSLRSIAALRRQTSVPIALSRTVKSPADVFAAGRESLARAVILEPLTVGGLARTRQCVAVAESAGLSVALSCRASAGLSTAAILQLAAATPALANGNETSYPQLRDDILAESLEIVEGMAVMPQGPGLGVEVDPAKLERYQIA